MSRVRSVERAFDVLAALSAGPLGVTDIAARVGLPKSTVARLLETLGAGDMVAQLPADGRYRLGTGLAALGAAARLGGDLVAIARPWLVELAASVGEAAGLSVPEGFSVRYVDQVDTLHEVRVRDWTGTRAPMHAVSSGLVLSGRTLRRPTCRRSCRPSSRLSPATPSPTRQRCVRVSPTCGATATPGSAMSSPTASRRSRQPSTTAPGWPSPPSMSTGLRSAFPHRARSRPSRSRWWPAPRTSPPAWPD